MTSRNTVVIFLLLGSIIIVLLVNIGLTRLSDLPIIIRRMNTNSFRYYSIDSLIRKKDCTIENDGSLNAQLIRPEAWFQRYWEPCIACADEERIGIRGDGGKWICNPVRELKHNKCVVISIGSNNEFSFEDEIIDRFGCDVHIFDHTVDPPSNFGMIKTKQHKFHFHKLGLDVTTHGFMLSLHDMISMVMAKSNAIVDILKIDCEGCEFDALTSPTSVNILQTRVKQLLLEIHNFREDFAAAKRYHVDKRSFSSLWVSLQSSSGMFPFHKEPNIEWSLNSSFAIEYAFLNKQFVRKYLP